MKDVLVEIVAAKRLEIDGLKAELSSAADGGAAGSAPRRDLLQRTAELLQQLAAQRAAGTAAPAFERRFEDSLAARAAGSAVAVVAEIKRRSPSRETLAAIAAPAALAATYEAAGAAAVSCLTDEKYFGGSVADLQAVAAAVAIPVLRKDFVLDEVQLAEAKAAGAAAVLLIAAVLGSRLAALLDCCDRLGLEALVEVHSAAEARALPPGVRVVGVNNRNLSTFETDLKVSEDLAPLVAAARVRIAESGIFSSADVARVAAAGYNAVLVGEALVKAADPAALLAAWRRGATGADASPATTASSTGIDNAISPTAAGGVQRLQSVAAMQRCIVDAHDVFIFDIDGVLMFGNAAVPGAPAAVQRLLDLKKRIYVVTNNSQPTPQQLVARMVGAGFAALPEHCVCSSSRGLQEYFREKKYRGKVYVIGNAGIAENLAAVDGIEVVMPPEHDAMATTPFAFGSSFEVDEEINAVVMGLDMAVNYFKIAFAHRILTRNPNALFVVTNKDIEVPVGDRTAPGTGSFIAALEACSRRQGEVVGKPSTLLLRSILRENADIPASRVCMIGDNVQTDIAFARNGGITAILVETGVHGEAAAVGAKPEMQPHYLAASVAEMVPAAAAGPC